MENKDNQLTKKSKFIVPDAAIKEFFNIKNVVDVIPYGNGHINKTFKVIFPSCQYILQQINEDVFQNPFAVTNNIEQVINYISKNIIYEGKDPRVCTLTTIPTVYNQNMAIIDDKYWRCMRYIEEGITYESTTNPLIFKEAGKAVGDFQKLLQGFPTRTIVDTIKHFHDTPYRYKQFLKAIDCNVCDRVKYCQKEIDFIMNNSSKIDIIEDLLKSEVIPKRITHNDTKLNNIMFSRKTGKALGLIDLDTVMKGSLLYDYGDALRIGASNASEDEIDLDKVTINFELFKAFTSGYLEASREIITDDEIKHLLDGYLIMTLEVGIRFLTDFIEGDKYFKLKNNQKKSRPFINLERSRNQLKLVYEINQNKEKLNLIVNEILKEQNYNL